MQAVNRKERCTYSQALPSQKRHKHRLLKMASSLTSCTAKSYWRRQVSLPFQAVALDRHTHLLTEMLFILRRVPLYI